MSNELDYKILIKCFCRDEYEDHNISKENTHVITQCILCGAKSTIITQIHIHDKGDSNNQKSEPNNV